MDVKVVGVTFPNPDGSSRREIIARMTEADTIKLERDPFNDYDKNAVKVCVFQDGVYKQIGFIGKDIASEISPRMRRGEKFDVRITNCGIYMDSPFCNLDISGI